MKCLPLDSRYTTTRIIEWPWDRGSPSTKSIVMSVHTPVGIGRVCSNLGGKISSFLFCWHTSHSLIKKKIYLLSHALPIEISLGSLQCPVIPGVPYKRVTVDIQ
jgi:hypothetical protein